MAELFTVQGQRQVRWFDENQQRLIDGMEVTFAVADGQTGSVRVPLASFNPETVRTLIEARAAAMHAVNAL